VIRTFRPSTPRHELDAMLKKWVRTPDETPQGGWLHSVRLALGMSAKQLAAMLHIAPNTVYDYERSEENGAIKIGTLQRIAKTMNCRLAYAIVPEHSLTRTLQNRRKMVARSCLMSLENRHGGHAADSALLLNAIAERLRPGEVWDRVVFIEWLTHRAEEQIQESRQEMLADIEGGDCEEDHSFDDEEDFSEDEEDSYEGAGTGEIRQEIETVIKYCKDQHRQNPVQVKPPAQRAPEEAGAPLSRHETHDEKRADGMGAKTDAWPRAAQKDLPVGAKAPTATVAPGGPRIRIL